MKPMKFFNYEKDQFFIKRSREHNFIRKLIYLNIEDFFPMFFSELKNFMGIKMI